MNLSATNSSRTPCAATSHWRWLTNCLGSRPLVRSPLNAEMSMKICQIAAEAGWANKVLNATANARLTPLPIIPNCMILPPERTTTHTENANGPTIWIIALAMASVTPGAWPVPHSSKSSVPRSHLNRSKLASECQESRVAGMVRSYPQISLLWLPCGCHSFLTDAQ